MSARKRRRHSGRSADVFPVDEDPNIPTQAPGFISNLEAKSGILPFERVEKMLDRVGAEFLAPSGPKLAQPAI